MTLDGAFEWLRAARDTPFFLYVHNWATHMPYDIVHADRKNWLAAKQEVIEGIQSDSAAALESMREGYRTAVERQSEVLVAAFLEELESLGRREDTVFAFLSDHGESWGERFSAKGDVQGVYHMHGATLFDEIVEVPLILSAPGRLDPGGRAAAGAYGRSPADAARPRGPARAGDRRRVAAPGRG